MSERTLMQVPRGVFKEAMARLQKALQCRTRITTQYKHHLRCKLIAEDGTWWECELNLMGRHSSGGALYAKAFGSLRSDGISMQFLDFVESICHQLISEQKEKQNNAHQSPE